MEKKLKKKKGKDVNLKNVIRAVSGQSLIYRGRRKYSAESTAKFLADISTNENYRNSDLIDYIQENIASDWILVKCLKKGIAFHHGALPKYIQTEIVEIV